MKEVHYIGPDGLPLDYIPDGQHGYPVISEVGSCYFVFTCMLKGTLFLRFFSNFFWHWS